MARAAGVGAAPRRRCPALPRDGDGGTLTDRKGDQLWPNIGAHSPCSRSFMRFSEIVSWLENCRHTRALSSVKTNFDGVQRDVRRFGTELALLDTSLRAYGPVSSAARVALVGYARTALSDTWEAKDASVPLDDPRAALRLMGAEHLIVDLQPGDRTQTTMLLAHGPRSASW